MKKFLLFFIFAGITNFVVCQEVLYYCSKPHSTGAWQVYRKDLNSGIISTISNNPLFNYWWVELSPDKKHLLMLRSPFSSAVDQFDYANCELVKSNADGSNYRVIIADNQNDWYAFGNPHWHPSGNKILMIIQPTNDSQPFYFITTDTAGNHPKLLSANYALDANWSHQGDKIVYIGIDIQGFIDATSFEVFIADYDDQLDNISNMMQLTDDNTRNHDPCFSPDDTRIAFSASDAALTNADLVIIDTIGTNRTIVLNDAGIHGGPLNWGTDSRIYHHSIYPGTSNFTINAFNINNQTDEAYFSDMNYDFISPYYANLVSVGSPRQVEDIYTSIYPNPFKVQTEISFSKNLNNAVLEIYTTYGQMVKKILNVTGQHMILNCSNLLAGVYFVRIIENQKMISTQKIVVID